MMEISHFKHVAQQSRRHKLRIQQSSSTQSHPLEDFSSNLEHVQFQPGLDTQVYNSSSISSQMLDFSNPNNAPKSHLNSSNFNVVSTSSGENVEKCGVWRSVVSYRSSDQMINFAARSRRSDNAMLVDMQEASADFSKFMNRNQDIQSAVSIPSSKISSHDHQYQEMNLDSSQLNSYRDVVTTAFIGQQAGNYIREDNVSNSNWSNQGGNELALRPAYREDSNVLNQNNASWISRVVEGGNQWNSELGFIPNKTEGRLRTVGNESSSQGLVLSLSSNPSSALHGSQFRERSIPEALSSRGFEVTDASQESKASKPTKPVSRSSGGSLQDVVGTSNNCNRQMMGPLGPFTGYATILKSSRFLRPAQQLLDEFCGIVGSKFVKVSDSWEKNPGEACALADAVKFADTEIQSKCSTSDVALPTSQRLDNQLGKLVGTAESSSCDSHRPENQHRKAKLFYMQEEVSRRYKQYHQQMQMVVASFESVAGLRGATPYISLALKTVSRHFRCLKNGISEQLRNIRTTLGEDLSSQTAGTSNIKSHASGSRMKIVDHNFSNQKFHGSDSGFHAPQQHIWRPQRGLPERAVSVLRAWLFEHFLHPYPTDTDKHMLATQTGLTRNQVSNWFINARVRLWKPMVEEIHMLETNSVTERDVNLVKEGTNSTIQGTNQRNSDNSSNELGTSDTTIKQFECSTIGPSSEIEQYKRSRVEGQITPGMDGGMMDFAPYYRSGLEMAGHGSVSLTLGLRQSADHRHVVEGARYHHEQLQQVDHIRRHFGSHIHEFVG